MDLELVRVFIRYVQNDVTHNTPVMNYGFQVKLAEGQTYKTTDTLKLGGNKMLTKK